MQKLIIILLLGMTFKVNAQTSLIIKLNYQPDHIYEETDKASVVSVHDFRKAWVISLNMSSAAFASAGKAPSNKTVETKAVSEKVEVPKMVHTSADSKRSIEMVEIKTANSSKVRCTFRIDYYVNGQFDGSVTNQW